MATTEAESKAWLMIRVPPPFIPLLAPLKDVELKDVTILSESDTPKTDAELETLFTSKPWGVVGFGGCVRYRCVRYRCV